MKKILITGKNSYIGNSFEQWVSQWPKEYNVNKISLRNEKWEKNDFGEYSTILHVAGIAHVSANPQMEELYYKINRDLTVKTANKAKKEGVNQFIFLSSIIIYGGSVDNNIINQSTKPQPDNFYGRSKLEAEEEIRKLEDDNFKILIIRPPMVYGKGSKGNYTRLSQIAQIAPVFPNIDNQRSMIHIDNLCEFMREVINQEESGIFFPQNREYVKTSEMVRTIAITHGKRIWMTTKFNFLMKPFLKLKISKKIFGNLVYDKSLSSYRNIDYQIRDFEKSIYLTEKDK